MKKEIKTSIRINASSEKVWNLLCAFDQYKAWNPFIKEIKGELKPKNKISILLQMNPKKTMTFKPQVLEFDSDHKSFAWLGHLMIPKLFDGLHSFKIEDHHDGSCTFHQNEQFSGILIRPMSSKIDGDITENFKKMNLALKKLAEKG